MARTTIPWGDGSGDNIYLDYNAASGDQTVTVSSDANGGASSRTKTVTFQTSAGSPQITQSLTVTQEARTTLLYGVNRAFTGVSGTEIVTDKYLFLTDSSDARYLPNWLLLFYAPDIPQTANAYMSAVSAKYASGTLRKGIWAYTNKGTGTTVPGVGLSLYYGSTQGKYFSLNKVSGAMVQGTSDATDAHRQGHEQPIAVMRLGNYIHIYTVGNGEWQSYGNIPQMAAHELPLVIGAAYKSDNTTLNEFYNSNGNNLDLELHLVTSQEEAEPIRQAFFARHTSQQ